MSSSSLGMLVRMVREHGAKKNFVAANLRTLSERNGFD